MCRLQAVELKSTLMDPIADWQSDYTRVKVIPSSPGYRPNPCRTPSLHRYDWLCWTVWQLIANDTTRWQRRIQCYFYKEMAQYATMHPFVYHNRPTLHGSKKLKLNNLRKAYPQRPLNTEFRWVAGELVQAGARSTAGGQVPARLLQEDQQAPQRYRAQDGRNQCARPCQGARPWPTAWAPKTYACMPEP